MDTESFFQGYSGLGVVLHTLRHLASRLWMNTAVSLTSLYAFVRPLPLLLSHIYSPVNVIIRMLCVVRHWANNLMEQIITGMEEWGLSLVCVFYLNSSFLPISDCLSTPPGKQTSKVVLDRERKMERGFRRVEHRFNNTKHGSLQLCCPTTLYTNLGPFVTPYLRHHYKQHSKNFRDGSQGPRILFVLLF